VIACPKPLCEIGSTRLLAALLLFSALLQTSVAQTVDATLLTQSARLENQGDRVLYHRSKDWFLKCDYQAKLDIRRCELTTLLLSKPEETKHPYSLRIIIGNMAAPPIAVIRTPLNLHLTKGVLMRVDSHSIGTLSYRSCDDSGCIVPFSMTGSVLKGMIKGLNVSFEFQELSGETQIAKFSLLGISSAMKIVEEFIKA